jgi:tetratricopeptide (TPR) repeat protein
MRRELQLASALFAVLLTAGEPRKLELRGQLEPVVRNATVFLRGADSPYYGETRTDPNGRFRFKSLPPGSYTVNTFVAGLGEAQRTVTVSPGLADAKGHVAVTLSFRDPSAAQLREAGTVSLQQLSIPEDARSEYFKAQKKLNKRDIQGAQRHLLKAVELAPAFSAARNHLGTIAYQSGQYADAEKHFREALRHDPSEYPPLVNLGGVLLNLQRFQEALEYNKKAVADRPEDPLANSQTGINHYFLGDLDLAYKYLMEAKRLEPSHFSEPQFFLGQIHARRGDRAAAIREFEELLARHPDASNANSIRERLEKLRQQ